MTFHDGSELGAASQGEAVEVEVLSPSLRGSREQIWSRSMRAEFDQERGFGNARGRTDALRTSMI